ncbi:MAG: DUF5908 family protein [Salibacteraceae bacterium]
MPIEIREVVIKATVTNNKSKGPGQAADTGMSAQEKQALISTCVEQVMQIINDKKDR